ncbi:MAG: DUF6538 domain-containing protein, partial [Croceibacterium sp.]
MLTQLAYWKSGDFCATTATKTATKGGTRQSLSGDSVKGVKAQRYMYRRGQYYWFRRAVPNDVRAAFGGRREVQVSLRTSDLATARHALARELGKYERAVSGARAASISDVHSDGLKESRTPTTREVEQGARAWFRDRRTRSVRELASTATTPEDALLVVARHSDDVRSGLAMAARNPAWTTRWVAEALIDDQRWNVEPGSDLERLIIQTVARGQRELDELLRQDITGEPRHHLDATFGPEVHERDEESERRGRRAKGVTLT